MQPTKQELEAALEVLQKLIAGIDIKDGKNLLDVWDIVDQQKNISNTISFLKNKINNYGK